MTSRRKTFFASLCVIVTLLGAYFAWTHLSALILLRWFVAETELPVVIHAASWDVRLGELLKGKIRGLRLDASYIPAELRFSFETPVIYRRNEGHWSIRLEPTILFGALPPVKGKIDLELEAKRRGHKRSDSMGVDFELHDSGRLQLANGSGALEIGSWKVNGSVFWDEGWAAETVLHAGDVKLRSADSRTAAEISDVRVESYIDWPDVPPVPLKTETKVRAGPFAVLFGKTRAEESGGQGQISFTFDGKRFENVDISVDKPVSVRARGSGAAGAFDARVELKATLEDLFTERIAKWLEADVAALRRAKASGTIAVKGKIMKQEGGGVQASGALQLNARTIELPRKDLFVDGVDLDLPLRYPADPDWGALAIAGVEFKSVRLKDLRVRARLPLGRVELSTQGDDGADRPIRQSVWGGAIDVSGLHARMSFGSGGPAELSAAVRGGPFRISELQKDLCVAQEHPLKGEVSFHYPRITSGEDSLGLIGKTEAVLLGGAAEIGDLHLSLEPRNPRLRFDLTWSDLDLQAIGAWTRIGDMRGSLEGSLRGANIFLTPLGPVPQSYDLTVRGRERGGKPIRFYGRAVDSIMELMGARREDMPWYARPLLSLGTLWYNLGPAVAEYMGFRARSDGDWTELTTFDPPPGPAGDDKNHYLLKGSAFKIPLNTHGVYPLIMRTDAFQGWLAGMLEYFKRRFSNENKAAQTECIPPW